MTKTKTVEGMAGNGYVARRELLTVRVTVDEHGESMSISDDQSIILHVPLEPLKGMIQPAGDWGQNK